MLATKIMLSLALALAAPAFAQGDAKAPAPKAETAKKDEKKDDKKAAPKEEKKDDKGKSPVKAASTSGPVVEMKTSLGTIKLELDEKAAPITTKNFLGYVEAKFYDGTVFHRVINGFMIQGGGYSKDGGKMAEKETKAGIKNEAQNGLKNDRGTIAMARTPNPDSATAQFFINHINNDMLNYPKPDGHGYAVFGKVVEGLDVVDKIANVPTGFNGGMQDVPNEDVKILSVTLVKPNS